MKKHLFKVFLCFIASGLSALDSAAISTLKTSTVLVAQEVFIDSQKSSEAPLWERLEAHLKTKILNEYMTCSTGSGFIVDGKGSILTNQHVISRENEQKAIRELTSGIQYYLNSSVPDAVLNKDERYRLRIDISKILKSSQLILRVSYNGEMHEGIEVVASEEESDIALLRASSLAGKTPLQLVQRDTVIAVGETITAIGFPLPSLFGGKLADQQTSVTKGNISALREGSYDIQHTAAINPGNSGGPLLNEEGRVVGINSAILRGSNGIFFSIGMEKIREFLINNDSESVLRENSDIAASTSSKNFRIQTETVGSSVILSSEIDTEVYQSGKKIGMIPLVYAMKTDSVTLKLKGTAGEADILLVRDAEVKKVRTVEVPLKPFSGEVSLKTNPEGAQVLIDGVLVGKTPYSGAVPTGERSIQFRLDGFRFPEKKITVKQTKTTPLTVNGQKLITVSLTPPCPAGTKFTSVNQEESIPSTNVSALILPEGEWTVTAENPDVIKTVTMKLDVKEGLTVDTSGWALEGTVFFANMAPGSSVKINDAEYGPIPETGMLKLPCGSHKIVVKAKHYLDYSVNIKIDSVKTETITLMQKRDEEAAGKALTRNLGWATLIGASISIPCLVYGMKEYDKELEKSYDTFSYDPKPNFFMYAGGYGMLATGLLGMLFYFSL